MLADSCGRFGNYCAPTSRRHNLTSLSKQRYTSVRCALRNSIALRENLDRRQMIAWFEHAAPDSAAQVGRDQAGWAPFRRGVDDRCSWQGRPTVAGRRGHGQFGHPRGQ
jgi:hypothetical protein